MAAAGAAVTVGLYVRAVIINCQLFIVHCTLFIAKGGCEDRKKLGRAVYLLPI